MGSDRYVPRRFVQPTLRFLRLEAASGILMVLAATIAVVWANSPAGDGYFEFFDNVITIDVSAGDAIDVDAADAVPEEHGEPAALADAGAEGHATAVLVTATEGGEVDDAAGEVHHGPVIKIGPLEIAHLTNLSIRDWINDALMALFFFVVGLEIKRELVVGELRDPKAAALPAVAALGGMIVPAAIYMAFNAGTPASHGWGIPMATDIAFAVGVLAMVGSKVPVGAKLFLLALAIVDDLGAIVVIALFYTEQLFFGWLGVGIVGLVIIWVMQRVHVRATVAYAVVGSLVWVAILESGVHATVAGVAIALLTPVKAFLSPEKFGNRADDLVESAKLYLPDSGGVHELDHHTLERVESQMSELQTLARESLPPLTRLEFALQPWTSYAIVPLFALANAGVVITADSLSSIGGDKVVLGVGLGLVLGKPLGVLGFSWLAVKAGVGRLPRGATWGHMLGAGMLAGIGFTVALFVSALSFDPGDAAADSAKIGIFVASLLAGVAGATYLKLLPDKKALPDKGDKGDKAGAAAH